MPVFLANTISILFREPVHPPQSYISPVTHWSWDWALSRENHGVLLRKTGEVAFLVLVSLALPFFFYWKEHMGRLEGSQPLSGNQDEGQRSKRNGSRGVCTTRPADTSQAAEAGISLANPHLTKLLKVGFCYMECKQPGGIPCPLLFLPHHGKVPPQKTVFTAWMPFGN